MGTASLNKNTAAGAHMDAMRQGQRDTTNTNVYIPVTKQNCPLARSPCMDENELIGCINVMPPALVAARLDAGSTLPAAAISEVGDRIL